MNNYKVLTLYYHRINVLQSDYHRLCVTPDNFREQVQWIKNRYCIARFEDDWSVLDSNAVVITFDDGYLDNLEYALPVLEELEVPATIFVSTGTMEQDKELWWDELENVLLIGENIPSHFQLIDPEFQYRWDTSTPELRENCYVGIHHLMKNFIDPERREEWLQRLWNWRGLHRTARKDYLTVSEEACRKLAASKMISLGAHTVNHPSLAALSRKQQEDEIKVSIHTLSEISGEKITLFSYPFGSYRANYSEDTMEICERYGIEKAAATDSGLWNFNINPYRIPRNVIRDWNKNEFGEKMEEYWEKG